MDDATLWWNNRHLDVQDYSEPEEETDGLNFEEEEQQDHCTKRDVADNVNMIALQRPTAQLFTGLLDVVAPLILVFLIKDSEKDSFKLDDDEKELVVDAFANYLKDSNFTMSPVGVLIATLSSIYGSKVVVAMWAKRQKHDEIELLKEQNALLKAKAKETKEAKETDAKEAKDIPLTKPNLQKEQRDDF